MVLVMSGVSIEQLQVMLPKACEWAEEQERVILENGTVLSPSQIADARVVGVQFPERIRLLRVESVPAPADPTLRQAAESTGLLTPNTIGLTLRYGIFVRDDFWDDRRLLAHEFTHTAQYERLCGFVGFLSRYLTECILGRYPDIPMEREAVIGAKKVCPS
jgi:hypothetical protein